MLLDLSAVFDMSSFLKHCSSLVSKKSQLFGFAPVLLAAFSVSFAASFSYSQYNTVVPSVLVPLLFI
jgi:hypothetical protein